MEVYRARRYRFFLYSTPLDSFTVRKVHVAVEKCTYRRPSTNASFVSCIIDEPDDIKVKAC